MDLKIVPISKAHKREEFDCGEESLNTYLKKYAKQSHKVGSVRTYVLIDGGDPHVIGYYSICTGAVSFDEVPENVKKGLGRYPVPCVLLTRLAVDRAHQGKKYSDLLIIDAFRKAAFVRESVGAHLFILDALNEKARQIYLRYGFTSSLTDPMKLLLPMSTVESALADLKDRAG